MNEIELRKWAYEQVSKDAPTGATSDHLLAEAEILMKWVQKGPDARAEQPPSVYAGLDIPDYQKRLSE